MSFFTLTASVCTDSSLVTWRSNQVIPADVRRLFDSHGKVVVMAVQTGKLKVNDVSTNLPVPTASKPFFDPFRMVSKRLSFGETTYNPFEVLSRRTEGCSLALGKPASTASWKSVFRPSERFVVAL